MEYITITYCVLILFLVFGIIGLMLGEAEPKSHKKAALKTQLVLGCLTIISGLILHLNYLMLPKVIAQKGAVYALTIFGVLAAIFSLSVLCLFKSFFPSKTKSADNMMIISKSLQY